MPKQINSSYNEVRTPFAKMTFSPDVPSTALSANEYNDGANIETDVRGIRSVAGDQEILGLVTPGTPVHVATAFRQDDNFWTIIATEEGYWYAAKNYFWYDITPVNFTGTYTQGQNITDSLNGTVPFFNDAKNPPMFWPEDTGYRITTTAATSGAGTATLTFAQQTAMAVPDITNTAGVFSYTSGEQVLVNQKITVSGAISTPVVVPTGTVTGVKITGTAGQFSCTSTALTVGMVITISGTLGGTGTITNYADPTSYRISVTNGSTSFTLIAAGGAAIVTTTGTPTGLTYTKNVGIVGTSGQFVCAPTTLLVGQQVIVSGTLSQTPFTLAGVTITGIAGEFACTAASQTIRPGQLLTISGTYGGTGSITGYTNPTTYVVSATNGTTTFTLRTTGGAAIVTTAGTPTGLTYSIAGPSITAYSNPTTYVISATNGETTFTLKTTAGAAIVTTAGVTTGLTFSIQPASIVGYTDPTTYYVITTNGFNQFTLSTSLAGTAVATLPGSAAGLTFVWQPFYVGQVIQVSDIVPVAYRGTYTVTASTATTVSYALSGTNGAQTTPGIIGPEFPKMIMYSNQVPMGISNIIYVSNTEYQIVLDQTQTAAPFANGESIQIANVNAYFNGVFDVISATTTTINFFAPNGLGAVYPGNSVGTVAPTYSWNYNPAWSAVSAGFMRMYNTPNVGSLLVAGNLTATNKASGQIENYPVTVQWSQSFGLNEAPLTWTPTIANVANQLEVPLRGKALDAFAANGQLYLCSYWDTVVFSPINYTTTSAPVLGVRLFNQGRGLLSANCFANTDKTIYGIDARDIWAFDGQQFTGLGNQRVKNWFFNQLDQTYTDRIFMQANTQRNQIEIYYPTVDAVNGVPNKMISYRYDLDCWNAPRDVSSACMAAESPIRTTADNIIWNYNDASRTVIYARGVTNEKLVQKDQTYSFIDDAPIVSYFKRDNLKLLNDYTGRCMVHRVLPEFVNMSNNELPIDPNISFATLTTAGTGTTATITFTAQPLRPFTVGDSIVVTGVTPNSYNGVSTVTDADLDSVSYDSAATGAMTKAGTVATNLIGEITITLEGANSVGQQLQSINSQSISSDTDQPWMQYNQNSFRVNNVEISNESNKQIWMVSALTWQYTATEDDR